MILLYKVKYHHFPDIYHKKLYYSLVYPLIENLFDFFFFFNNISFLFVISTGTGLISAFHFRRESSKYISTFSLKPEDIHENI